jgi:hypothetical protein
MKGRYILENLDSDVRLILKFILEKQDGGA